MMMGLVLMGGMILAVPASAQFSSSRQRPSAARGASVSTQSRGSDRQVSRSSESRQVRSESRPQVSRSSESRQVRSESRQVRSESRPQVSRSSESRPQGSVRSHNNDHRVNVSPQVSRSTTSSQVQSRQAADRTRTGVTNVAPGRGGNDNGNVTQGTRGGGNRGTVGTVRTGRERPSSQMSGNGTARPAQPAVTPSNMDDNGRGGRGSVGQGDNKGGRGGNRDGGGVGNDRGRGGNRDGGGVGNDRGRGNNRDGRGNDRNGRGNNRNGFDNDRGNHGGNHHGYGPSSRGGHSRPYNYNSHPHRDHFSYAHSHHNWSRPLPPPPRPYRPAPLRYYRPVIPAHYRPYYGAPVIDRILGITFGTLFDVSLDYLYTSGYYIDGYQDNIVYLRDVSMLNLLWPDVMLSYDAGRLANAQFVFASTYRDRSRYNRIYHDLSAVYGPPISVESGIATWFGGNTTGYVTLSMGTDYGRYYTTLSIGY